MDGDRGHNANLMPFAGGKIAPALLVPTPENHISELPGISLTLTTFVPSFNASESFAIDPIILRDQIFTVTGGASLWSAVRFVNSDSSLWKRDSSGSLVTVDTLPLQFHTSRPATLPLPPEGTGHFWYLRYINEEGPDPWDLASTIEDEWIIMNSPKIYRLDRPPIGNTVGNTVRFQIAVFDAVPEFVKLYASARITVIYNRS